MQLDQGKVNFLLDITYGSSSKAQVVTAIADRFRPEILMCTHNVSSSHTATEGDQEFVFKILPSASFLCRVRDDYYPTIIIAPSAGFEIEQLRKEIEYTGIPKERVIISARAVVIKPFHKSAEAKAMGLENHLGSTLSGQSAAVNEKAARSSTIKLAKDYPELAEIAHVVDYPEYSSKLAEALDSGLTALCELPQGFPLSIDYSIEYPYNTYRNVSPAQAMSDFGLSPKRYLGKVTGNIRVYPIRVSNRFKDDDISKVTLDVTYPNDSEKTVRSSAKELGMSYSDVNAIVEKVEYNGESVVPFGFDFKVLAIQGVVGTSGTFETDMTEISWRNLSDRIGATVEEITTLTKLNRRIAIPDRATSVELLKKAKITIDPDYLSFTFMNYHIPELENCTDPTEALMNDDLQKWGEELEDCLDEAGMLDVDVPIVQTGRDLSNVLFMDDA